MANDEFVRPPSILARDHSARRLALCPPNEFNELVSVADGALAALKAQSESKRVGDEEAGSARIGRPCIIARIQRTGRRSTQLRRLRHGNIVSSATQPKGCARGKRCYCQNVGYRRPISFLSAGRWCLGCGLTGRRPAADLALAAGFPSQPRLSAPKKRNGRRVARRPLRFGRLRNAVLPQSSLEPALIGDDEVGALVSGNASAE
jgi:hypothetical protein